MLRVLFAALAGMLLLVGAWLFLRGDRAGEAATAPGRAMGVESIPTALAEPDTAPIERAIALAAEAIEPAPPTVADPERPTGVLAGRLVIDGEPLSEAIELKLAPADRDAHEATRGTLRTDALGRFRREGLPVDWSGSLGLPAPYAVDVTEFGWSQTIPIAGLREDLVIEVERSPALRFRVLRADRTPAADASARVEQHETGGWSDDAARADAGGRVRMRRSNSPPHAIVVRAQHEDGANVSARFGGDALRPSGPYGDIDLGDLVLVQGREVELRCVEADGTPIARAQARLRFPDFSADRTTDEHGALRIGFPQAPVDLKVEIAGYLGAEARIGADQGRLDIVLRRANLLRVEVSNALDRPWANGRVGVVTPRRAFGEGNLRPIGFRGRVSSRLQVGVGARVEHVLEVDLDAGGAVELRGIDTGLEFELLVRDQLGHVAVRDRQAGLADEERRVVRLRLGREPCALEVRVIDVEATPLSGAEVKLRGELFTISDSTGVDGTIRFENLFSPRLDLSARAQGLQETRIDAVDPCAGPVTVTLMEGRTLTVELRDEAGRDVEAGTLELHDLSGERSFRAQGTPRRFEDLPFEPLVLIWTFCGSERRLEVDAAQDSAEFVLPTLGEVQVAIEGWIPVEREFLNLRVESLDGLAPGCGTHWIGAARQGVPLLPGRYRLAAWVMQVDRGGGPEERPLGAPREVLVEAGASVDVTLGP